MLYAKLELYKITRELATFVTTIVCHFLRFHVQILGYNLIQPDSKFTKRVGIDVVIVKDNNGTCLA